MMKQTRKTKAGISGFAKRLTNHCIRKGVKVSSKRIQVMLFLDRFNTGIEADELWLLMRKEKIQISFPYVYQCLNWFAELDLVSKKSDLEKKQRYFVNREALA